MNYINEFLKYIKVLKKYSKYTIENYRIDLLDYYDFYHDILSVTERDISNYLEYLYKKQLIKDNKI